MRWGCRRSGWLPDRNGQTRRKAPTPKGRIANGRKPVAPPFGSPMPALPSPASDTSETFDEFEQRLGLGKRSYSKRQAQDILGVGESTLDKLVHQGLLRPFQPAGQKHVFWGPDLARHLWQSRASTSNRAFPAAKPKSPKQVTPPRGRGRPRKGPIHRIQGASSS